MAAAGTILVQAKVAGLTTGDIDVRKKFDLADTPTAILHNIINCSTAGSLVLLPLGGVAVSTIDGIWLKPSGSQVWVDPCVSAAGEEYKKIAVADSTVTYFQPVLSTDIETGLAASVAVIASVANTKVEYLVIGQAS